MSYDNISNVMTSKIANLSAEDMVINKNEIKNILYLSINNCGLVGGLTSNNTEKMSIKENHTIDTFA